VALVPSGMLGVCASIISRPSWEPIFKYTLGFGALVCVIAAVVMSYFEAGSVVSSTVVATIRVSSQDIDPDGSKEEDKGVRLDFKAVYDKVENRFKRHQLDPPKLQQTSSSSQANSSCKQQHQTQNGNAVNSSSLNIRNRKTKKPYPEMASTNNLNKTTADKLNQQGKTIAQQNVLDFMDDGNSSSSGNSATSSTAANGKKDTYSLGSAQNCSNGKKKKISSSIISTQQSSQVPPAPPSQPTTKPKKSQSKQETLSNALSEKVVKAKTEEETSSTTTEGSNSEDFMTSYPEKERKHSLKSNTIDLKSGKTCKKEKQEKGKPSGSESYENITGSTELLASKTNNEEGRKKNNSAKKKEQNVTSFGNFTNSTSSRNGSPKQDMWDTPRPPSGDGLSELAAQTEAFVMQKPPKRNNSGGDPSANSVNGLMSGNMSSMGSLGNSNPNIYIPQALHHQQFNNIMAQQQRLQQQENLRLPKKPGVIGQPRPAQNQGMGLLMQQPQTQLSSGSGMFPNNANIFGSNPSVGLVSEGTNIPLTAQNPNNLNKRHTSPTLTSGRASGTSSSNSIWGPDILPNNGCDIWGRRTNLDSGSNIPPYFNTSGNVVKPSSDSSFYPRGSVTTFRGPGAYPQQQMQNGQATGTSLSSGMHSLADSHFTDTRSSRPSLPISGNGFAPGNNNGGSGLASNGPDNSYLFSGGTVANELLNNLWQMNGGPSHPEQQFRSQANFSGGQTNPQYGLTQPTAAQPPTNGQQHGYLHRMSSDPTNVVRMPPRPSMLCLLILFFIKCVPKSLIID
jgi:hypothetical protein